MCVCTYIYIYMYIYIERERQTNICVYIYIYIYICREQYGGIDRERDGLLRRAAIPICPEMEVATPISF